MTCLSWSTGWRARQTRGLRSVFFLQRLACHEDLDSLCCWCSRVCPLDILRGDAIELRHRDRRGGGLRWFGRRRRDRRPRLRAPRVCRCGLRGVAHLYKRQRRRLRPGGLRLRRQGPHRLWAIFRAVCLCHSSEQLRRRRSCGNDVRSDRRCRALTDGWSGCGLSRGRRLFENLPEPGLQFRVDKVLDAPAATHLRYVRR
jgi:hypothetical protein